MNAKRILNNYRNRGNVKMPRSVYRKGGASMRKRKPKYQTQGTVEQILTDSIPSSVMDSVIGQGLMNVDVDTANRLAQVAEQAKDIETVMQGLAFFRDVSRDEISQVLEQSGLTKEDVRNYVYDQDFYKDAGKLTQYGIRKAMKLKGLRNGGRHLAKAQQQFNMDDLNRQIASSGGLLSGVRFGEGSSIGQAIVDAVNKGYSPAQILSSFMNPGGKYTMTDVNQALRSIDSPFVKQGMQFGEDSVFGQSILKMANQGMFDEYLKRRGGAKKKAKYQTQGTVQQMPAAGMMGSKYLERLKNDYEVDKLVDLYRRLGLPVLPETVVTAKKKGGGVRKKAKLPKNRFRASNPGNGLTPAQRAMLMQGLSGTVGDTTILPEVVITPTETSRTFSPVSSQYTPAEQQFLAEEAELVNRMRSNPNFGLGSVAKKIGTTQQLRPVGTTQQLGSSKGLSGAQERVQQMKHGGSMCRGLPGGPNEFPM